jgi:ABC-type branched-subunit amino acid transport system ATPase component
MNAGRVISEGDPQTVMKDAAVVDAYLGSTAA